MRKLIALFFIFALAEPLSVEAFSLMEIEHCKIQFSQLKKLVYFISKYDLVNNKVVKEARPYSAEDIYNLLN